MSLPHPLSFSGAEGNRLAADLWDGNGQPVRFFHGGGQTRRAWDNTARRVAMAGMRAITVDQRGHGESDWVKSGNYTFRDFGEDVAAVARKVAADYHAAPAVVGASMGGLASLYAQQNIGPLFDSIILVDVTPRMEQSGIDRIQGFMRAHMKEGFATLEEAGDAIAQYLPNRKRPSSLDGLRKNLRRRENGRYYWHWDPKFATSERGINYQIEEFTQSLVDGLPDMHLPVLLVRGMQSELVGEEHAREFVDAAPMADYVDVSGAGHMVAGDKNDIFCNAILDFLTDEEAA